MSQTGLKNDDLYLDIQGQNGLETKKNCVIFCECKNFSTAGILPSNLICIDSLKFLDCSKKL